MSISKSEMILFLNWHKNKKMFSTGQWIFGILFFIVFSVIMVYQYRKDLRLHKKYYKGTFWILIAFIGFIATMAAIKFLFV